MALTLRTSGNGVHIANLPPPRQALSDFRLSERLSMSFESQPEGGVRRAYFNVGEDRIALEIAKGNRSETEIAGHRLVIDDGQLYIDNRRFDFQRRDFAKPRVKAESGPPSPEQQLANLKQRFPKAKFIGEAANLSSVVIGNDVKLEGTIHLKPGLQIADGTRIASGAVVKGGIISGSLIFGEVSGGQVSNSMIDGGAKVTGGVLNRVEMSRDSVVSGGNLDSMILLRGSKVSGGDLRDFTLEQNQTVSGGKHHGARQVDTEKLRAAGGVLRKIDRDSAQEALEALKDGLYEAKQWKPENLREVSIKRGVVAELSDAVAGAEKIATRLEGAKDQAEVKRILAELDQICISGSDAMARLRGESAQSTPKATAKKSAQASTGASNIGIDPEVFRRYVETTLLQLGPLPTAAPMGPGQPTYSQALMQMQYADIARAYQPQATGYLPEQLHPYAQYQMPPYLFGPQPSPQMMTTVPPQYPQQPSGWGKAAMLGGAGLLLGLGLGSFGMGTFGLGMGMMPMMGMGMGMGMFPGMGMFGF